MNLLPLSTTDDRGRSVGVIDDRRLLREAGGRSSPRYQLALRLRAAMRGKSSEVTPWTLFAIAATVGSAIAVARLVPRLFMPESVVGVAIIGGIATLATTRSRFAPNLAASAVAEGVCGTCAYPLHGLLPETDGCVVCAECGSAWKASRIVVSEETRTPAQAPRRHFLQREILGSVKPQSLMTDDRGRFVGRLGEGLRGMSAETRASMAAEEFRTIRGTMRRIGNPVRFAVAVPSALCTFVFLTLALTDAPSATLTQTLTRIFFILLIGGGITAAAACMDVGIPPPRVRAIMLAYGRCPSCGADLDREIRRDGYVVCNCRASWSERDVCRKPGTQPASASQSENSPPLPGPQ